MIIYLLEVFMNQVIDTILNHRSIRSYLDKELPEEHLELLVRCAQKAPSSNNGQPVTIIAVTDKAKKAQLAELCGNQAFIAEAGVFFVFCIDFYRGKLACEKTNNEFYITDELSATVIGTFDAGLAMQNMIVAAESLGYGTVPIGGILNDSHAVIKLLEIPDYVFPICGLVVGFPKEQSAVKPRLPLKAVFNREKYDMNQRIYIDEYDEVMTKYMEERTNGESRRNWSETISRVYRVKGRRSIKQAMENQKFYNR